MLRPSFPVVPVRTVWTPTEAGTGRSTAAQFPERAPSPSPMAVELIEGRSQMGRIVVSENVTLDGVVQDPTGEEGFRHGGWFASVGDRDRDERARVMLDEAVSTEAML